MARFGETGDWGLQAIVGGSNSILMDTNKQPYSLEIMGIQQNEHGDGDDQNFLISFSDHFLTSSVILDDGLHALYKPFYPVLDSITTTTTQSCNVLSPKQSKNDLEEVEGEQELIQKTNTCAPISRKRKSQQERVENKVKADDLSLDKWAWRKYGQKPIKGSQYPRSYYRCSTMKGCIARKQVEKSHTDPDVYIVAYTAEHCHNQPAKQNSLAGTVRQKFPTPKVGSRETCSSEKQGKVSNSSKNKIEPPSSRRDLETFEEQSNVKKESLLESEDRRIQDGYTNSDEFFFSDFMINDDLFSDFLYDFDVAREFQQL